MSLPGAPVQLCQLAVSQAGVGGLLAGHSVVLPLLRKK